MEVVEEKYIYWLSECSKELLGKIGSKNGNLGELIKAGIKVPNGFAISTSAFEKVLRNAKSKILQIFSSINIEDYNSLDSKSREIREIIEKAIVPEEIEGGIVDALRKMKGNSFAVRSSAIGEDSPTNSFAGLFESYLGIKREEIMNYVKKCWSSLFTPRVIAYRCGKKISNELLMSVGIQEMINAKVSGVVFTLNPINGNEEEMIIEANIGVGGVVRGDKLSNRYKIWKKKEEILEKIEPNGKILSLKEIKEIVRISKKVEEIFKTPQDIEWAIDKNLEFPENVFVLQSRNETVWSKKTTEEKVLNYVVEKLVE